MKKRASVIASVAEEEHRAWKATLTWMVAILIITPMLFAWIFVGCGEEEESVSASAVEISGESSGFEAAFSECYEDHQHNYNDSPPPTVVMVTEHETYNGFGESQIDHFLVICKDGHTIKVDAG